jgi:hypothetical protein
MRTDGQTDRWTDMTKLMVAFHNFANASKKKKSLQKGRTRNQLSFVTIQRKKKRVKKEGRKEGRKEI